MDKYNAGTLNAKFHVVGIGASAGGLDAVCRLLATLPAKTGMAFVFIEHLGPGQESIDPEILQRAAPFPVQQVTGSLCPEPDHLYIITNNKIVTVINGVFKLAPLTDKDNPGNAIDLLFSALATVYKNYATGIVLSGILNDGMAGLHVIKSNRGTTFAWEESRAVFYDKPEKAAKHKPIDFILSPVEIANQLMAINSPSTAAHFKYGIEDTMSEQDNEIFKQILTVLHLRHGVDFTNYKQNTLKRRIARRMAMNKIEKRADYLKFLSETKSEQDALYNDMLISVTSFFRDTQTFDVLCKILPQVISQKAAGEPLRIWIAGCATGEEAYSVAICLQEHFCDTAAPIKMKIFATDISEKALAKARTGAYRQNEMEGVSASQLQRFFIKTDIGYQVKEVLRDMCVFGHHNLLHDPPFSKIDLVSCRNVMIYLEPVLQKKALSIFHYSLNDDGYLVLGKSESIGTNTDIFKAYNPTEKIYVKKNSLDKLVRLPDFDQR